MPFTSALLIVGALALAAFPGTSGFFSKDEILAFAADRGGIYWIFAIGGYVGGPADRVLLVPDRLPGRLPASPARRRGSSSGGTCTTPSRSTRRRASPRTPTSASPGPEHHIAERDVADARRDGACSASWRCSRAGSRSPGSTTTIEHFLEPTFEDSLAVLRSSRRSPTRGSACWSAALIASPGSRSPTCSTSSSRGVTARLIERLPAPALLPPPQVVLRRGCIDALVYRPALAIGRFANSVFERVVVDGHRRARRRRGPRRRRRSSATRSRASSAPTRCCCVGGFAALGALLPGGRAADGERAALAPAGRRAGRAACCRGPPARWVGVARGAGRARRSRSAWSRRLRLRRGRAPARGRREPGSPSLGVRYQLGGRRDQRLPRPADRGPVGGGDRLRRRCAATRGRALAPLLLPARRSARPRRSAPSSPRTCCSSSSSST